MSLLFILEDIIKEDLLMKSIIFLIAGLLFLYPTKVYSQAVEGVQSFSQPEGSWRREVQEAKKEQTKIKPLQRFYDDSGKFAIENITKAEQIFCYEVFPLDEKYEGYTIDGFPIRGFCGIINEEVKNLIVEHFFASETNVVFDKSEECVIEPKIIIRFVRGVDYTDVLLSSPCHSFAVFYGGNVHVYNYKPAAAIIDALVKAFNNKHIEFISPALLNQLLPIGVIQNEQQRKLINRRNEPIRKWIEKAEEKEIKRAEENKKNNSGWNKLKMRNLNTAP